MHITKVVVEGFKSFKEKTIFEFQPGLNILVGHDEAGKKNLLYAIQFVITGHQFQQLTQANLAKMLYSSSAGVRVKSAYVEIIVDNKDKSIREQGAEIKLKRMITSSSKDVYIVNGQSATMEEVMKILQSKLSKANPYYIISQRKTQEICTSSTEKCLAMLCEMAGSLKDLKSEESMSEKDSMIKHDEIRRKKKLEKDLEADRNHRQQVLKKIRVAKDRLKSIGSLFKQTRFDFCEVASEDIVRGIESVWTTVNEMKEEEEFKSLALEYRGLIIEQFECPTEFMTAADAVAKNRLFQHVVDTDRASNEIQKRMTERKLPGYANFITNTQSEEEPIMVFHQFDLAFETFDMVMRLTTNTQPGMNLVVKGLFDNFILCPTSKIAREAAQSRGKTCVTLDGYVVHAPGDVPDGFSSRNLTRFQLFGTYKKAYESEKIQKNLLEEEKKLLEKIDGMISRNEAEYQQIKINTFQIEQKAVQGSLKSLEAEISSLREWIESEKEEPELGPVFCLKESKDLIILKEIALLKVSGNDLLLKAENLTKVNCLYEKFTNIASAVESLKKQWKVAHQNDIKVPQEKVSNKRPNVNEINQQLSLVKGEIDDTVLLVDRAPLHLLEQAGGFSLLSHQLIATTLVPGLLENADINIIGLRFDDATQSSRVLKVSKKEARQFLDPPLENKTLP